MILTEQEIQELSDLIERSDFFDCVVPFARAVETLVLERVHKQILEEVCFKMASGSPNRARIHALLDTWK